MPRGAEAREMADAGQQGPDGGKRRGSPPAPVARFALAVFTVLTDLCRSGVGTARLLLDDGTIEIGLRASDDLRPFDTSKLSGPERRAPDGPPAPPPRQPPPARAARPGRARVKGPPTPQGPPFPRPVPGPS